MSDLQPTPTNLPTDAVRDQDKIMLVLAYFNIFGLIPLLTVKDSEYVKWHAKQGLVLSVGVVVAQIGVMILAAIMAAMVRVLGAAFGCLNMIIGLGYFALAIFCMVKAVGGVRFRIPVVADMADKLNI